MAEFIAKAAILAHIEEQSRECSEEYDAEQVLGDIEDFPAADVVERKTGKWIILSNEQMRKKNSFGFLFASDSWMNYECSSCGHLVHNTTNGSEENRSKYCPNCGARMEG